MLLSTSLISQITQSESLLTPPLQQDDAYDAVASNVQVVSEKPNDQQHQKSGLSGDMCGCDRALP